MAGRKSIVCQAQNTEGTKASIKNRAAFKHSVYRENGSSIAHFQIISQTTPMGRTLIKLHVYSKVELAMSM